MSSRSFFRGVLWSVVALLAVAHVGGGWYFSGRLIDDGFVPNPDVVVAPVGDFEIEEVSYGSSLGQMDALYLPASGTTWVIHVHGKGGTPAEAENLLGPIQQAGYPQLSITYRNDESQPLDPSGYYQYGATEWDDVRGAFEFAESNGAEAVVFSGFSTGSSHVLSFLFRHNFDEIRGLIFDAPNIDFGDTVNFKFGQTDMPVLPMKVPKTVTWAAKFITSLRMGVNWKTIDYVDKSSVSLRIPVLVHHGTEDQSVPIDQSVAFVEAAPDLVRLIPVQGASHVGSYDANPEEYIDTVLSFLAEVG